MPALVVFHTPPEATPMYQVCLSSGCTAMVLTRPDISAGPTARKRSSVNVPAAHGILVGALPRQVPVEPVVARLGRKR